MAGAFSKIAEHRLHFPNVTELFKTKAGFVPNIRYGKDKVNCQFFGYDFFQRNEIPCFFTHFYLYIYRQYINARIFNTKHVQICR